MSKVAPFVLTRPGWAWSLIILASVLAAIGAAEYARISSEHERIALLQTTAERSGFEMKLQTLNGNQMGALGLLGLVDPNIKLEARGELAPNGKGISMLMQSLARATNAEGAFIVGQDGVIKSSWGVGKPLTGVDVKFRPYAQMALRGKENVYAAIGTTTGRRTLYFAAPMYAGNTPDTPVIGAVVARASVLHLEGLLAGKADIALLLSPQGVVFASNRDEWIGRLAGPATPERIKAIREVKQFGTLFDKKAPEPLPFAVVPGVTVLEGHRQAVASANVQWNDPGGNWTLVLIEDLNRSLPLAPRTWVGVAGGMTMLLFGILLLQTLRSHYAQVLSTQKLRDHAAQQEKMAQQKSQLAKALMRLQQASTQEGLAQTFLDELHRMLGVLQGAVYVINAEIPEQLALAACYGCADDVPSVVSLGESLLGQCALEKRPIQIEKPAPSYWRISSGLGTAMPNQVLITPILLNDLVLGVVEMAVLQPWTADNQNALEDLLPLLALNLEILRRNRHTEDAFLAEEFSKQDIPPAPMSEPLS